MQQRNSTKRRTEDEKFLKAVNDLIEAVRHEAEVSNDPLTRSSLSNILERFATQRG